jgi:hypothetical protein
MVNGVARGQVFLPVLRFQLVSFTPNALLPFSLTRTNGQNLGIFQNQWFFSKIAEHCIHKYFLFLQYSKVLIRYL